MKASLDAGVGRKLTRASLRHWPLPPFHPQGDKEDRGAVLVIAGSEEIPGAALLAATAALRAGAGKLTLLTSAAVASGLALMLPEARVVALPFRATSSALQRVIRPLVEQSSAVLVGPGMQDERFCVTVAASVLEWAGKQAVVLDAFAIGTLHQKVRHPWVLATPHPGEMAHLTGHLKEAICSDPLGFAVAAAERFGVCITLKGAMTVIASAPPEGTKAVSWSFTGGSAGLATSGSGDVLAGLATGLAARGLDPVATAAWAVMTHAYAGRALERAHGGPGYVARELLHPIPRTLKSFQSSPRSRVELRRRLS